MPTKRVIERTVSKTLKNETNFGTITKRSFGGIVTKENSKCHAWSKIIGNAVILIETMLVISPSYARATENYLFDQAVESVAAEGAWRILRQITIPNFGTHVGASLLREIKTEGKLSRTFCL